MEERVCSLTSSSSAGLWSSDWALLPHDLLVLIIDKLVHDNLFDYFRFSAVCKSWNSIALNHKEKLVPPQVPWLLNRRCSSHRDIVCEPNPSFYNIFTNSEISNIKLPGAFKRKSFCGSSHGWLVFSDDNLTLIVLNPLSGKTIRLPRLPTKGESPDYYYVVVKVILSRDPSLGSFEVLAVFGTFFGPATSFTDQVAHLKHGDQSWSCSPEIHFRSVAFFKNQIFGLSGHDGISSLNIDTSTKVIKITNMNIAVPRPEHEWTWNSNRNFQHDWNCDFHLDFVESTSGDLLIVDSQRRIHKLVIHSNGGLELIPTVDLGGDCLFLGGNHSISISASKYPLCKPNFVYHASCYYDEKTILGFNFEDGSELKLNWSRPFSTWFMPSMNQFARSSIS